VNEFKFDEADMEQTQGTFHRILHANMDDVEKNFLDVARFLDAPTPRRILADELMKSEIREKEEKEKGKEEREEGGEGEKGNEKEREKETEVRWEKEEKQKNREGKEKEKEKEKETTTTTEEGVDRGGEGGGVPQIKLMSLSGKKIHIRHDQGPLVALKDLIKILGPPPAKSQTAEPDLEKLKAEAIKARNEQMQKVFEQRYRVLSPLSHTALGDTVYYYHTLLYPHHTTPHHTTPHHTTPHHTTPTQHTTPQHTTPQHDSPDKQCVGWVTDRESESTSWRRRDTQQPKKLE